MRRIQTFLMLALCLCLLAVSAASAEQAPGSGALTVTFFDNYPGGSETMSTVAAGSAAVEAAAPERPGYAFAGWFDAWDGGAPYDFAKPVTEDLSLFAHWEKTANTVTFKYNDEGENRTVLVPDGEKVPQPEDPVSEVYSFLGWFRDGAYTRPFDFDTPVTGPVTVYAGWSKSSAQLTFNLNYTGAPEPVTVHVSMNAPVELPEGVETVRPLYRFDGWYLKSFPAEGDLPVDLGAGIEADTVVYAKWTRTHYAVEFNPNQRGMDSVIVEVPVENPAAEVPMITREGYTADETWYEDAALTRAADLSAIADDITVFAKWNAVSYTVVFDPNDGSEPVSQSVEFGAKVTRPENPVKEGSTFLGWFTQAEGGDQFNFEDSAASSDLTLFAHWMAADDMGGTITVTFHYNAPSLGKKMGGDYAAVEIGKGEAIGDRMPEDPARKTNWIFRGWYTDPECTVSFDPSAVLLEDTDVYARILSANVFEAEYVNLAGKHGVGSSVELNEDAMIFDFSKIGTGSGEGAEEVSNYFYVAGLYQNGLYIEFEIYSPRAIENCALEMRVSSEFKELHYNPLTPETYRIDINPVGGVNGEVNDSTNFEYELPLTLPLPNTLKESDPDGEKTPFEKVMVSYKFHLDEGWNVVRFTTNNNWNYGSGTFTANAPMIDCITIYAPADIRLDMQKYEAFYEKALAQRSWMFEEAGGEGY
ncbi:MAG: InlB B-repeat-containing protein [Clostridia bacterium]|nr:InlB B-repeat-containing protein [Clostridia bacterium]